MNRVRTSPPLLAPEPPVPARLPRILTRRAFARTALLGGAAALPLLPEGTAQAAATGDWSVAGNSGTDPAKNYLGTKDAKPLVLRTGGVERLRITPDGKIGVGLTSPGGRLHVVRSDGGAIRGDFTGTGPAQGVRGVTNSAQGFGVLGENTSASATGDTAGVVGRSAGSGAGVAGAGYRGVTGTSSVSGGIGVFGTSDVAGGAGVSGSTTASGSTTCAVVATASGPTSNALKAVVSGGSVSYAVWGVADPASYAGIFQGRVNVYGDLYTSGTLSKAAGTFQIDHPQDPSGKYLFHSFVESPDMLNVYSGTVTAGPDGTAEVVLPGYFDSLNSDVRYQLTALGAPMPDLHVAVPHARGRFTVGGAQPGGRVCWQVTGVRQDAYAKAHRVVPEVDKPARERGTFLHPVELGRPQHLGVTPR